MSCVVCLFVDDVSLLRKVSLDNIYIYIMYIYMYIYTMICMFQYIISL